MALFGFQVVAWLCLGWVHGLYGPQSKEEVAEQFGWSEVVQGKVPGTAATWFFFLTALACWDGSMFLLQVCRDRYFVSLNHTGFRQPRRRVTTGLCISWSCQNAVTLGSNAMTAPWLSLETCCVVQC